MSEQKFQMGRVVIGPVGDFVAVEDFVSINEYDEETIQRRAEMFRDPIHKIMTVASKEKIKRGCLVTYEHDGTVRVVRPEIRPYEPNELSSI